MKVTKKPLTELHPPERNVRMHTDKQLKEFRRSVEMFGQIRPIVVDEDGIILAGNGLFETLLSMGRTEADCYVVSGMTEAQKKKLNEEIKAFYLDERGEEIGIIEQMQLLDLFEQKLAPVIYNKALDDAKRWYSQMMDNLESDFYALYKNES